MKKYKLQKNAIIAGVTSCALSLVIAGSVISERNKQTGIDNKAAYEQTMEEQNTNGMLEVEGEAGKKHVEVTTLTEEEKVLQPGFIATSYLLDQLGYIENTKSQSFESEEDFITYVCDNDLSIDDFFKNISSISAIYESEEIENNDIVIKSEILSLVKNNQKLLIETLTHSSYIIDTKMFLQTAGFYDKELNGGRYYKSAVDYAVKKHNITPDDMKLIIFNGLIDLDSNVNNDEIFESIDGYYNILYISWDEEGYMAPIELIIISGSQKQKVY